MTCSLPAPHPKRGALRHIGPETVRHAASLVRQGKVISLNLPLAGPTLGRPELQHHARMHNQVRPISGGRFNVVNDDVVTFSPQALSHWDALAHWGVIDPGDSGVFYDGTGLGDTFPEFGSKTLGIDTLAGGIFTRGVLLDMVDYFGASEAGFLPDGQNFGLVDIEGALKRQGLELRPGDGVIFFTGFQERLRRDPEAWVFQGPKYNPIAPGLLAETLPLFEAARTFALISDNPAVEPMPMGEGPLHEGALKKLGIYLAELWALEELVRHCRETGVWEFALASVPLDIKGAFGSPSNAMAVL